MNNKVLFLLLMVMAFTVAACSGHGTHIEKNVTVTGETMRVKVKATVNGRSVQDYDKDFNVAGLDKAQRDSIAKHIMDSLDVSDK